MWKLFYDHYSKNEEERERKEEGEEERKKRDMQFAATEHNVKSIFLYKNVKGNKANNIKCYY